ARKRTACWPRRFCCGRIFRRGCSTISCSPPRTRCNGASSHPPRPRTHPRLAARRRKSRMKRTRRLRRATTRTRSRIEALYQGGKLDAAILVDFAQKTQFDETVAALASLCAVPIEVVDRLMTAERPDPVLILCKSAGWDWSIAKAIIMVRPGG